MQKKMVEQHATDDRILFLYKNNILRCEPYFGDTTKLAEFLSELDPMQQLEFVGFCPKKFNEISGWWQEVVCFLELRNNMSVLVEVIYLGGKRRLPVDIMYLIWHFLCADFLEFESFWNVKFCKITA